MKINLPLIALAITLFSSGVVSAEEPPTSPATGTELLLKRKPKPSFMHEGGLFYMIFVAPNTVLGDYGIAYTPRMNFPLSKNTSISADVPLAFGMNWAVNSQEGGSGIFSVQLPVKGTFNYGLGADDDSSFGVFAGTGLGMSYVSYMDGFGSDSGMLIGAYIDAGTRFETPKRSLSISANTILSPDAVIAGLKLAAMF